MLVAVIFNGIQAHVKFSLFNRQQRHKLIKMITVTNSEQLDIASHLREERDELKYRLARYDDFWEWFEDEYGETEVEVWNKFEKYEDEKASAEAVK